MKEFTMQLKDFEGNVVKESNLILEEGDTLLMHFARHVTLEQANKMFKHMKEALENNKGLIGIPEGITFSVLSIREKKGE